MQDEIITNELLILVGTKAQGFIRKRVLKGNYLQGSTTKNYSTAPMPIPYGLFIQKVMTEKAFKDDQKSDNPKYKWWQSKSGEGLVLLPGGYEKWRQINHKTTDNVNLHWSGRMMRNLGIIRTENEFTELGFPSPEENKKAYYQHAGAGRNRIKRLFMGLTQEEIKNLSTEVVSFVVKNLTFEVSG